MATGYIIWDSKKRALVGGPFLTTADADAFKNRVASKTEGYLTDKNSKTSGGSQYTRESVTLA